MSDTPIDPLFLFDFDTVTSPTPPTTTSRDVTIVQPRQQHQTQFQQHASTPSQMILRKRTYGMTMYDDETTSIESSGNDITAMFAPASSSSITSQVTNTPVSPSKRQRINPPDDTSLSSSIPLLFYLKQETMDELLAEGFARLNEPLVLPPVLPMFKKKLPEDELVNRILSRDDTHRLQNKGGNLVELSQQMNVPVTASPPRTPPRLQQTASVQNSHQMQAPSPRNSRQMSIVIQQQTPGSLSRTNSTQLQQQQQQQPQQQTIDTATSVQQMVFIPTSSDPRNAATISPRNFSSQGHATRPRTDRKQFWNQF